jgi:two-component system sensor histidine kinase/response regulator
MENEPRPDAASAALPEPIDWETLNALREYQAEGEPDLVQELIGMFRAEAPALLADIRTAIAAGEADKLRHSAHTLKGSSNNLGVRQVAALSAEIEKKGRSGTVEGADALLDELEREFTRALQALDAGQRGQG